MSGDSVKVRPIKSPIKVSRVIPYAIIVKVIIILILIYMAFIVWRRRIVKKHRKNSSSIQKNPFEIAKERISSIKTTGFTKEIYVELSHIIREFIENVQYLNALEMTTEEIKQNKNIFSLNEDNFNELVQFLEKADLIKYAKFEVSHIDIESDKSKAMDMIEKFFLNK